MKGNCKSSGLDKLGLKEFYGVMYAIKMDIEQPLTVSAKRRIKHHRLELAIT